MFQSVHRLLKAPESHEEHGFIAPTAGLLYTP